MKKNQFFLILLGILNLLIPLGLLAQYLISVRHGSEFSIEVFPFCKTIFHLVFGATFIVLGIRLGGFLKNKPKLPARLMNGWLISNIVFAIIGFINGFSMNPIAIGIIAAIHWYFTRAFKRLLDEHTEGA